MPKRRTFGCGSLLPFFLLLSLISIPNFLRAQQSEVPPASEHSETDGDRIVTHRPYLYPIKHVAHPVTWLESGLTPILGFVEKKMPEERKAKMGRNAGVRIGFAGLGASTGFGPSIAPYYKKGFELELPALVTYKFYQSVGFRSSFPAMAEKETSVGIEVLGDYVSRPADFFYGIGNKTAASNGSRFRTVSRTAGVALNLRLRKIWSARLESGFRSIGITKPREPKPMMVVFQGQDIPGIETGATMSITTASFQRNTKDHPTWAASGGLQRVEASLIEGQKGGDFSYWRYQLDLQQFLPLSEDRRTVIALRADVETNRSKGGSSVPFFDLPTIGGASTVRGYRTNRFTDKSAMSASVEYRYQIWRYFDWGLFVDGGQVAPEILDFALNRFHMGYGIRFFARSEERRGVIVDLAHSREAWVLYLDLSSLF